MSGPRAGGARAGGGDGRVVPVSSGRDAWAYPAARAGSRLDGSVYTTGPVTAPTSRRVGNRGTGRVEVRRRSPGCSGARSGSPRPVPAPQRTVRKSVWVVPPKSRRVTGPFRSKVRWRAARGRYPPLRRLPPWISPGAGCPRLKAGYLPPDSKRVLSSALRDRRGSQRHRDRRLE